MQKHIVIMNGSGGVGKDSFCNYCSVYANTETISIVDKVKNVAYVAGWNGEKDEASRKLLSDIKLAMEAYNNSPLNYVLDKCADFMVAKDKKDVEILFVMLREKKDIDAIKEHFDNVFTILIKSNRVKQISSNVADANVDRIDYDIVIHNDFEKINLMYTARNMVGILRQITYKDDNFKKKLLREKFIDYGSKESKILIATP